MGDDECKIHLDTMREVHMLVVLNLKMSHDSVTTTFPLQYFSFLWIEDLGLTNKSGFVIDL